MFRCCSLETSHPRHLPQSPKVCSIHLCLFFCFAYTLTRVLLESETELRELSAKFLLLSQFPACWASCHFHWAGFPSRLASTAWPLTDLGFCCVWLLPVGAKLRLLKPVTSKSRHQMCQGSVQFPRFCLATAKIWNGGPVSQFSYSSEFYSASKRKAHLWGMRVGWSQRRGLNPSWLPPFIHLSPPPLACPMQTVPARRAVCFTWGFHSGPQVIFCSIFEAFSSVF